MTSAQKNRLLEKYEISRVQIWEDDNYRPIYDVDPLHFNGESPSQFLTKQIRNRVQLILQEGCERNLKDITPKDVELWNHAEIAQIGPVFMWAAISDNYELLEACHKRRSDVINYNLFDTLPKYSNTCKPRVNALHLAALSGSRSCFIHLWDRGCKYISELNSTESEIIKSDLLPFRRFNKSIIDFMDGFSPVHLAILGNHKHILENFTRGFGDRSNWFSHTCLHAALLSNAMDCLKYIIQEEILNPADAYNQKGMTVFHSAAAEGDILALDFMTSVIEKEPRPVDWITHNKERKSALHIAAHRGQESTVRYLIIKADADPTIKDSYGRSAIRYIRLYCLNLDPSEIIHQRLNSTLDLSENELSIHLGYLLKHSSPADGDLSFLKTLLYEEKVNVMQHPSCLALLESKWKYLRPYLYLQVVVSILWVFITSSSILQTVHIECRNTTIARNDPNFDESQSTLFIVPAAANSTHYILLTANLLQIIIFIKGYNSLKEFILNKHNILQTSFVSSLIFYHFSSSCDLRRWSGTLTIMIGWFMVSSSISKLSWLFIEKCMAVYIDTLKTLTLIIGFSFPLWVAFLFLFCVLRPELFEKLFLSQMRVLEMAVGEVDKNDVWQSQPSTTLLICSSFILLVNISLIACLPNLVEDKQELQEKAETSKIARKMKIIIFYERVCRRKMYLPFNSICLSDLLMYLLFVSKNFLFESDKKIRVDLNDPSQSSEEIHQDIIDAAMKIISDQNKE